MELASFNAFDGESVVKSLKEHTDLWSGAVMHDNRLLSLRDIHGGIWHADTLHILPLEGKEDELISLAKEWSADEVDYIVGSDAESLLGQYGFGNVKILRVWWD